VSDPRDEQVIRAFRERAIAAGFSLEQAAFLAGMFLSFFDVLAAVVPDAGRRAKVITLLTDEKGESING
jgi:hypothetical protein